MRLARATAVLAMFVGTAHADGDSLVDMLGPREVALGDAMRAGATGASAIALNPAGLPLSRDVVFEGGYGYRAGDSASLFGISACDTTAGVPGCFFYNYAGASPELDGATMSTTTHVGGLVSAYSITPRVFLGSTVKYFHFDSNVPMQPSSSGLTGDLGLTVRLTDMVNLGAAGYNLLGASSTQFPRAIGGGVQVRPFPLLTASFDSRWRLEGPSGARYGGGLEFFPRTSSGQTGFPIRAGALHDNTLGATYVSGGFGVAAMKYGIDIAARRGINGSNETLVIASMRFYGPRLRGPNLDAEAE
jgi:hypothetical protein